MKIINQVKDLFSISDIGLAVTTIMVIGLMIIPIPSYVLDYLMVLNIGTAVMILLVSMFLTEPLDFAAFPSILLIITLFRLSLNISSTKLILALGAEFDGKVVKKNIIKIK